MKIRSRTALPLVAVLAAAALPAASPAGSAAEASPARLPQRLCAKSFDRAVDTYVRTTHDRDVAGFAAVLHENVTAVLADGAVLYGKDQTVGFIERFFAAPGWTQTFTELTREVRGCGTGFVLFDSVYTPAPGAPGEPMVIGVTFVFERGRWLALHNQDSTGPASGTP